MKRVGFLWDELISWGNLLRAAEQARRGKRLRPDVQAFHYNLEHELLELQRDLTARTYIPGKHRSFHVFHPKKRLITAAPYRDRVVHHALTQVLEPVFEPRFIHDSYACRKGKGTHAAVRRAQAFARRFAYVLKADVRRFFPSIDHKILLELVSRKIKDPNVLWLVDRLVACCDLPVDDHPGYFPGDDLFTPSERRRGLPIGNQTSQFFANVYLDPLDHFVTSTLQQGAYVRYVDDFLVFGDRKRELARIRDQVARFLMRLRLRLHPTKNTILPVREGIRFLGYRVFPTHKLLVKENVRRFRRRVRKLQDRFSRGEIGLEEVRCRLMSWSGHAAQADTRLLRRRLFATMVFQRAPAD